jgi:hypothetical protein
MAVTINDIRAISATLPRSYEAVVRGQARWRVGRLVYAALSHDDTIMGFGFPRKERAALVRFQFLDQRAGDYHTDWDGAATPPSPCCAPSPDVTATARVYVSSSASCPPSATSSGAAGPRTTCASTTPG